MSVLATAINQYNTCSELRRRMAMLSALQQACEELHQLLLQDRTHRGEAKAWLINTLAQLQHISPAARWACFHPCDTYPSSSDRHSYGRSSQQQAQLSPVAACKDAELHLLQLLTELAPADVSTLLLRNPDWLCDFLTASRDRIRTWFGGFGPTSIQHFKYGARALANYALSERAAAWQHLVWSGKHSQSPVAVAAKPHYFGELDVVATVRNLAHSCPGFWSSDELMRSCQAGDWLGLDREAVAKELLRLLHDQRSSRQRPLQQLLSDFLASTDWGPLCHRLLPLLPDKGLLQVAHTLADVMCDSKQKQRRQQGCSNTGLLSCWCSEQVSSCRQLAQAAAGKGQQKEQKCPVDLQAVAVPATQLACVSEPHMLLLGALQLVNQGKDSWTLDQLLLADALTCYCGQLLALLRQDEDAISHLRTLVAAAAALWPAESTSAPPAGATAAAAAERGAAPAGNGTAGWQQQLLAAVHEQAAPQRLLLVLAAGWLLRLQVMLQLAGAVDTPAGAQREQQHHQLRHAAVRLSTGDMCYLLTSSAAVSRPADAEVLHDAAPMQLEVAQQQQETQQEQQQGNQQHKVQHQQGTHQQQQQQQAAADPQQGPPANKTPLRRGSLAAVKANADSDSSSSEGEKHSRKHGKRRSSSHTHISRKRKDRRSSKKHHRKHSRRHSGSDAHLPSSNSDSGSSSSSRRKCRKRRRQSGRSSRHSSSDAASSGEEDEWAGMDLDAGGKLLDAAEFQQRTYSTAQHASASKGQAEQQQQEEGDAQQLTCSELDIVQVQERLASLAVGGRLWQWPQCVVAVSPDDRPESVDRSVHVRAAGSTASGASAETGTQAQHVVVTGSIVDVADAVAQLWLCCTLQQAALA